MLGDADAIGAGRVDHQDTARAGATTPLSTPVPARATIRRAARRPAAGVNCGARTISVGVGEIDGKIGA
jgi:hypothetical protein